MIDTRPNLESTIGLKAIKRSFVRASENTMTPIMLLSPATRKIVGAVAGESGLKEPAFDILNHLVSI
jgi:hypothetical protein